uniref:Uncharacterized protein n=1 Tax=Anguilla anguilla TaxID=7936 RepID=A0A0E9UDE2_ANGAN
MRSGGFRAGQGRACLRCPRSTAEALAVSADGGTTGLSKIEEKWGGKYLGNKSIKHTMQ